MDTHATSTPRWLGEHSEQVLAARDDPERLLMVFRSSAVPMVMLDDERRYVEANRAAQEALGMSLEELRHRRADELTPPHLIDVFQANWKRMRETGHLMSTEVNRPHGHFLGLSYYGMADVLPGRHVIAFSTESSTEDGDLPTVAASDGPHLTRRELEVLTLSANGLNGPGVAQELGLSSATVRTHFAHIYRKLQVADRAAAVAKAMRLGLIR